MEHIVEKKNYLSPKMDVVEMRERTNLLSDSDPSAEALEQEVIEVIIED